MVIFEINIILIHFLNIGSLENNFCRDEIFIRSKPTWTASFELEYLKIIDFDKDLTIYPKVGYKLNLL